jgi:TIR domain
MPKPEADAPDASSSGDIRIFIAYRREDTSGQAGRLYDALSARFGDESVFMDVDTIDLGADFVQVLDEAVGSCHVLVALIGRHWLTAADEQGHRRIDDPRDFVGLEIQAALSRGIPVIPALVEGTRMPSRKDLPEGLVPLTRRQALELGTGARWRFDVDRLVKFLERLAGAEITTHRQLPPEPESTKATGKTGRRVNLAAPRRLLAALAALAILGAALAVVLVMRGSHHARTPAASHMSESGRLADAIDAELLIAHIPQGIRKTCKPIDPIAAAVFLRSVSCSQGSKGKVTYSRAHSGDALRAFFLQQTSSAGLHYPTSHTCRSHRPAADEWRRQGPQTHVEERARHTEGRVLCYERSAALWIAWTDTPTKIFASASRPRSQWAALYGWWRTAAGPEKELPMAASMGGKLGPYPDAIERELLLLHIPAPVRKTCTRSVNFDRKVFLRAVACSQVPGKGGVQYMYAHSGSALRAYSQERIDGAGLSFPTSGTCARNGTAAETWMRSGAIVHVERRIHSADGRVLCFDAGGRAFIEWTDTSTGIYGSAFRPIGERAELYRWWRTEAGPGPLEGFGMEMGGTSGSMGGTTGTGTGTSGMTTSGH